MLQELTELVFYCAGFVRGLRLGPCGGTLKGKGGRGMGRKSKPRVTFLVSKF
nr:MAG TPA: hypothetical protein [Caudoviricetes sp.]